MAEYILIRGIRVAKSFKQETFGRLKTIGPRFLLPTGPTAKRHAFQVCSCVCGSVRVVRTNNLASGNTTSCGCLNSELVAKCNVTHNTTHGESDKTPEYLCWCNMQKRCCNPNHKAYHSYGGRGIHICERWRGPDGYSNFLADMGRRPSKSHSIDRIDVYGNYCPENCRWATSKEQTRNRTTTRLVTHNGKTQCLTDWAAELGTGRVTLARRLKRGLTLDGLARS